MSTPAWLHDAQSLPNENGSFNPSADPNAFIQMPSAATPFDYNLMQNQQYQQRIQNGNHPRNGSPAFQNPMYQTQPIVPTKRSRPREDSIGASPRPGPGMLPPSRSQTPQQTPYSGFQGAVNGAQGAYPNPSSYHRFSNAGSTASLSPSIQPQPFNPQGPPPRVQTVSPSPFSPANQNFGAQASPPPQSDNGSQVSTPQNGGSNYMQGIPYGGAINQAFTPPVNPNNTNPQPLHNLSQQQQQQRMNELRQRQYIQQMQANNPSMQNRYPGMGANPSVNSSSQMANLAAMGGRVQQPQQMRPSGHEQFVRNVAPWMQMRGFPFNPHPTVLGRPVNLMQLFSLVIKLGGSKAVTARSQWPAVAQGLQVAPAQSGMAAGELQHYWQANMLPYESSYMQTQQQRQRAMHDQVRMQRPNQNGEIAGGQDPYSPLKQMSAHVQESGPPHPVGSQTPNQNGYLTPSKRIESQQPNTRALQLNGYLTPQPGSMDARHPSFHNRQTSHMPNQVYMSPSQPDRLQIQATKVAKKAKPKDQGEHGYPRRPEPRLERYSPTCDLIITASTLERHGGLHIDAVKELGDHVASFRPKMPGDVAASSRVKASLLHELGIIDVRALTLSLRSGIKGEVRLALDTFCNISFQMPVDLNRCDDLVDALVECAEEQVELLAENAPEVSDAMLINSYEEMQRGSRMENQAFQLPSEYGSLDYDLEHAVDRLICITTILRNLSSLEMNWEQLATSPVICVLTNVMRYLGTRNMLLRTHTNTIDFAKDVVIYLSNVSQHIELPGKEEALCILHFLLSFAPCPPPTNAGEEEVTFPSYEPLSHCYLPHAIDSFAKLLAKDEPNRGHFRSIFYADGSSSTPFDLLTKAFGFAISVLPKFIVLATLKDEQQHAQMKHTIQARGPYVAQGLLAAEIVVGLIPMSEHSLAKAWLSSSDGFAAHLTKMILYFGSLPPPRHDPQLPHNLRLQEVEQIYATVAYRGIAMLRKLAERARDAETDTIGLSLGILPGKESLLSNLMKPHIEPGLLRQICTYAALDT
ncbi:MAG: hypothetical protein Q9222_000542 [Ikaeria aurantiellina]